MELKFASGYALGKAKRGLNCTFMELKLLTILRNICPQYVLIVPLWN